MAVSHQFVLHTPYGVRIKALRPSTAEMMRRLNDKGAASLVVDPTVYEYTDFSRDMVLTIERSVDGGTPSLVGSTIWFLRRRRLELPRAPSPAQLILTFEDANALLRRRLVAYFPGETNPLNGGLEYTNKSDSADNMIIEVMKENFGNWAIPARDWSAFFNIQSSPDLGPFVEKQFPWQECLRTIQDIARTSEQLGTDMYFDVVCTQPPTPTAPTPHYTLEFQTFVGSRGIDHREGSSSPVLIGSEIGNLANVVVEDDWTEEENHIFAGGGGEGLLRDVQEAEDASLVAQSPVGLIEGWVDVRDQYSDVETEARSTLQHRITRTTVTGEFRDSRVARWGVDVGFGDLATVRVRNWRADCRIDVESFRVERDTGEQIQVQLTGIVNA